MPVRDGIGLDILEDSFFVIVVYSRTRAYFAVVGTVGISRKGRMRQNLAKIVETSNGDCAVCIMGVVL
jgi:hypothetical protein